MSALISLKATTRRGCFSQISWGSSEGHVTGSHSQDIYPPAVMVLWKIAQELTEIVHFQKTDYQDIFDKSLLEHHNVDEWQHRSLDPSDNCHQSIPNTSLKGMTVSTILFGDYLFISTKKRFPATQIAARAQVEQMKHKIASNQAASWPDSHEKGWETKAPHNHQLFSFP